MAFSSLCAGGTPRGACCSTRPFLAAEAYDVEVSESVVGGASESAARWVLVNRVLLVWGGASVGAPPLAAKAVIRRCAARSSVYWATSLCWSGFVATSNYSRSVSSVSTIAVTTSRWILVFLSMVAHSESNRLRSLESLSAAASFPGRFGGGRTSWVLALFGCCRVVTRVGVSVAVVAVCGRSGAAASRDGVAGLIR